MWLLRPVYSSRVSEISNLSFDSEVLVVCLYQHILYGEVTDMCSRLQLYCNIVKTVISK